MHPRDECKIMVTAAPISTRRLCFDILKVPKQELLALVADHESYYNPYTKKKRRLDGTIKERRIEPSTDYLKKLQRKIDRRILKPGLEYLPNEIMGGRTGRSVRMNAKQHQFSEALMKYDVENFFPSIKAKEVFHIFRYRLNFCEEAANILSHLTTYQGHVPQGAPTSTSLAVLALAPTCDDLKHYCDSKGLKFSIWVDDITISGAKQQLTNSRYDISKILAKAPYIINAEKDSGILQKGSKQARSVTGIIIDNNSRLTIGRQKLRYIKNRVNQQRKTDSSTRGKLLFLKQVNPKQAAKLLHEFDKNLKKK